MSNLPTNFNINRIMGIKGDKGDTGPQGPPGAGGKTFIVTGSVSKGDVLANDLGHTAGTHVVKGTPTNVLSAGGIVAIAEADYTDGQTTTPYLPGQTIPASVFSDLGAGLSSLLQLASTGRGIRQNFWSGGEIRVGNVDSQGNVTLDPFVPATTSPIHTYNPKTYGAPWDGIHDDRPAILAMVADIIARQSTANQGARIDLPPGLGYLSDDWHITLPLHVHGRGGGNTVKASGWTMAPGKSVFIDGVNASPDGNQASNAIVENFDLFSTMLISTGSASITNARSINTFYEKGRCVAHSGNSACFFRANVGGTSSGSGDPGGFSTTTPDPSGASPIADGGVTWLAEAFVVLYRPNAVHVVGQREEIPGYPKYYFEVTSVSSDAKTGGPIAGSGGTVTGVAIHGTYATIQTSTAHGLTQGTVVYLMGPFNGITGLNDKFAQVLDIVDSTHFNVVVDVGVTGTWSSGGNVQTTPADMTAPLENEVIVDNHVTWLTKKHVGFAISEVCQIRNFFIQGFTGAAIHVHGGASSFYPAIDTTADFVRVARGDISFCGAGVISRGGDSQGGSVRDVTTVNLAINRTTLDTRRGAGGIGFDDGSLGGNKYSGCYAQVAFGPGYFFSGGGCTKADGCFDESGYKLGIGSNSIWEGSSTSGYCGTSMKAAALTAREGIIIDPAGVQGFVSIDQTVPVTGTSVGPMKNYLGRNDGDTIIGFATAKDGGQVYGWRASERVDAGASAYPSGWYIFGRSTNQFEQNFAVAQAGASLPSGNTLPGAGGSNGQAIWAFEKLYIGPGYSGAGDPPSIDFGTATPGSLFWTKGSVRWNTNVASGQPEGWRCTASGTPGTWSAMANHP